MKCAKDLCQVASRTFNSTYDSAVVSGGFDRGSGPKNQTEANEGMMGPDGVDELIIHQRVAVSPIAIASRRRRARPPGNMIRDRRQSRCVGMWDVLVECCDENCAVTAGGTILLSRIRRNRLIVIVGEGDRREDRTRSHDVVRQLVASRAAEE